MYTANDPTRARERKSRVRVAVSVRARAESPILQAIRFAADLGRDVGELDCLVRSIQIHAAAMLGAAALNL